MKHLRMPLLPAALLLAVMAPSVAAAQTYVSTQQPPPSVVVTGSAEVEMVPDQAIVRIGVLRPAGSAKDAQDEANKVVAAVLKEIGSVGVAKDKIQTSRLTLTPMYGQQRPGSNEVPRITGYTATNTITVTLDNLTQIGPVIDAGLDNGANQLEGVQFRLKNDRAARERALAEAVTEARGKASAMAAPLGITLGPVLELTDSGVSVTPMADRGEAVAFYAAKAATPTPVSPGQLVIRASVMLRIAISGQPQ